MKKVIFHPEFVKRFIDVHGYPLFVFIDSNLPEWISQYQIMNIDLKLEGYTTFKINRAIDDVFRYLSYSYKEAMIRIDDTKLTRIKIITGVGSAIVPHLQYDTDRKDFIERFLSDYETHLYKNIKVGKISIKQLIYYYDYWFKYRNISRVFSYSDSECIEIYVKHLEKNGYICVKSDKHIIYKRSAS